MRDRSNFWQMVDRTKPIKLRVFGDTELGDCLDYFSEIQADSTLPPNETLAASERLTLIRSEMDLRHADARHRRTQRLAGWAITVGMVSIVVAVTSAVVQYFVHKPTAASWPAATETPILATPIASPTATPAPLAVPQIAMPDPVATPTVPDLTTPTPKSTAPEQRRKKRRTQSETKKKKDQDGSVEQLLRSLFRPKPTPRPNRR